MKYNDINRYYSVMDIVEYGAKLKKRIYLKKAPEYIN